MKRTRRNVDDIVDAILDDQPIPQGRIAGEDVEVLRAAIALRATEDPTEDFAATVPTTPAADSRVGRRAMLGAVAAAAVGGVIADRTLLSEPHRAAQGQLRPDRGTWVAVAKTDDVGAAPVRFATSRVVGFVSRKDAALTAVSGACTHLGCLLQANPKAERLDCPCHRTSFAPDGKLLFSQLEAQPGPLPTMATRENNGQVEVFLPEA